MKNNCATNFPSNFPELLINSGKSLEHLGILEIAWNWKNAIRVVEFLCMQKYVILGGDVYEFKDDNLHTTYDSWYINKDRKQNEQEFIEETKKKSISYINQYYKQKGENFYYSIVFDKM